jgi:hypothetical protein
MERAREVLQSMEKEPPANTDACNRYALDNTRALRAHARAFSECGLILGSRMVARQFDDGA